MIIFGQKFKDMDYRVTISTLMQKVCDILVEECPCVTNCISQRRENIVVEVPKAAVQKVVSILGRHFRDVADIKRASSMIELLHDFILVKPMISESPLLDEAGFSTPSLEKTLVDLASDKENAEIPDSTIQLEFQKAFEVYQVNTSKMLRYAARKGEKEQITERLTAIRQDRVDLVRKVQEYFSSKPVDKVWAFGSFSRMEERADSDIDLLVQYSPGSKQSLMDHAGFYLELSKLLGRSVDLVEEGTLLPYAARTANQDKYQIYERIS